MAKPEKWELMGITKEEYENLVNSELARIEKENHRIKDEYKPWKALGIPEKEWKEKVTQAFGAVKKEQPRTEREELIQVIKTSSKRAEIAASLILNRGMTYLQAKQRALELMPPTGGSLSQQEEALLDKIARLADQKRIRRGRKEAKSAEEYAKRKALGSRAYGHR